ncbi:hypothetical protein E2C01_007290 [Portunus trituberculatus]|uniref:Uncharacterized protein n=1 Tax=Portunus trituberculatus TaxID=210409 RepID=A0A5B7CXS6_PORTR|nr:hypothetical protein [Portunus trituberculatus]
METSAYKELSYRMKGFRAVTVLVAVVTVVLCLVVGIGCWILVSGVTENENVLHNVETKEKIEVEIVEGKVHEPLRLKESKAPLNKAGRVVQHIAEIDFQEGALGDSRPEEPRPAPPVPAVPAMPQMIDGVVGVRIQPPQVDETHTNFMHSAAAPQAQYTRNDLSANQPAPVVTQPQESQELRKALIDQLYNFTQEIATDIEQVGLFQTLASRASEQYMRNTMQWLGDYTTQLMGSEELAHVRSKRSLFLSVATPGLTYLSYAAFGKFLFNEVTAIAEYNVEGRKLSGDPTAEFLDSTFWSANPQDTDKTVLTAATDNWEPQVNKVSIEFIGEILNTLLNMMREYLMKDHVMECLWFMFCQDLNHQAKYADIYGFLARVNR